MHPAKTRVLCGVPAPGVQAYLLPAWRLLVGPPRGLVRFLPFFVPARRSFRTTCDGRVHQRGKLR